MIETQTQDQRLREREAGRRRLREIAEAHGFETEDRTDGLHLLVPWTMRLDDGSFAEGVDLVLVGSLAELTKALGY